MIALWYGLLLPMSLCAQHNDKVWVIGGDAINQFSSGFQWGTMIADFSQDPVQFKYDDRLTLDMTGTDACISDDAGHLMMYTNGMHVHNGEHTTIAGLDTISYSVYWEIFNIKDLLPDGSDWKSGLPGRQWVLILPHLSEKGDYLIYHHAFKPTPNGTSKVIAGILETKVRIDEEHPLGHVIYKEKEVAFGSFQGGMNAVRHANGRDWWIMHRAEYNAAFYVYLLDPSGFHLVHTYTGATKIDSRSSQFVGYFSPDGDKYVSSETSGVLLDTLNLTIYDFDRCSGDIQRKEYKKFVKQILYGAVSFSPDGRYLYIPNGDHVFQYDMKSEPILASERNIATYDGSIFQYNEWDPGTNLRFSTIVNGPDGRLYCIPPGNTRSIHTIEYPEEEGEAADVRQNSIQLPTQNFNSLPNFPNFRTGPLDGSTCDTLGIDNQPIARYRYEQDTIDQLNVRFTDLSYYRPETWLWDFGDGSYHEDRKPYWHRFPSAGTYEVCLTVSNENSKTLIVGL